MKQTTRRAICALFLLLCTVYPTAMIAHSHDNMIESVNDDYDPLEDDDPFADEEEEQLNCIERLKQWGLSWYYKASIGLNIAKVKARRWWCKTGRARATHACRTAQKSALTGVAFGAGAGVALLIGHLYNKKSDTA